ncbi:MAG: SUMF1/EgtB/PvdO family nonheme iron enzyme, partial [Acidobacteriota bacterium]
DGYYAASPAQDPPGPGSGSGRVVRGGSWSYDPRRLRSSDRARYDPADRSDLLGFRCARDAST